MVTLAIPVLMARALEIVRAYFSSTFIGIYLLALGAATLVVVACAILLLQWLAARLSGRVVNRLNAMTAGQMRALLSGADVGGERTERMQCASRSGQGRRWQSLPPVLSAEIAAISDEAAAKAIGTIRGRAAEIAASARLQATPRRVSDLGRAAAHDVLQVAAISAPARLRHFDSRGLRGDAGAVARSALCRIAPMAR